MNLHFSREELAARCERTTESMSAAGLDGLLVMKQESEYWLTGFDTVGYSVFHCLYLGVDGRLVLLTRSADVRQARYTSTIEDVREWVDGEDADPVGQLRDLLQELGCSGAQLGVEMDAACMTGRAWERFEEVFDGFCTLTDASNLIDRQRIAKSPAEIEYVRRAAALADDSLQAAERLALPGAFEGDIDAAMLGAVLRGGGDYPNGKVIGSGLGALLVRGFSARRRLDPTDQLQLEFGGAYRHYHACLMRTLLTGQASKRHRRMHTASVEALHACQEACRPGATMGDVFDAHARVYDAAGYSEMRLNACGYSLGATWPPSWMDYPMFFPGNDEPIVENMVLFMHMILIDHQHGATMAVGESVLTHATGCERLSQLPLNLVIDGKAA